MADDGEARHEEIESEDTFLSAAMSVESKALCRPAPSPGSEGKAGPGGECVESESQDTEKASPFVESTALCHSGPRPATAPESEGKVAPGGECVEIESEDTDGIGSTADDRALAEWLPRAPGTDKTLCPRCGRTGRYRRVRGRRCFACPFCRHQIYPMAKLGYGRSTLPPAIWDKVTKLAVDAMCAKKIPRAVFLRRALGVSYPTARRIRVFMISLLASALPPPKPPRPETGALDRAFDRVFQRVYGNGRNDT